MIPARELRTPTTTGTQTGREGGHGGSMVIASGVGVVKLAMVVVVTVTGGLGKLLTLVKMNGLA